MPPPPLIARAVVFSKGKADRTYTAEWFKEYGFDHATYVVSDGDDVAEYKRSTGCEVIVAAGTRSLAEKREWARDRLTSARSPWLVWWEDNIRKVTRVPASHYHLPSLAGPTPQMRPLFNGTAIGPLDALALIAEDVAKAEALGCVYGGFASNDNPMFRKTKYRTVAFVWSKMAYARRGGPPWPPVKEKDDYAYTAAALATTGRVLVNNYLYPWAKMNEGRGGSPTLDARAPARREVVQWLLAHYPGLYREKDRAGRPPGTEIQLRFTKEAQVEAWRRTLPPDVGGDSEKKERS